MSKQQKLDEFTGLTKRAISLLDKIAKEADKEASEFCNNGDFHTSARLRSIASDMRIAAGYASSGYAKGRQLDIPDNDGVIRPMAGGS